MTALGDKYAPAAWTGMHPQRCATEQRTIATTMTLRLSLASHFCLHLRYRADSDKTGRPTLSWVASLRSLTCRLPWLAPRRDI